jgi:AraC-like DNA-binding protein
MPGIDETRTPWPLIFSHIQVPTPRIEFHLHEGYEIYFLISGDVNYFVEKKIYPLQFGDLIFTNNREIHKPSFRSDRLYERICLEFQPAVIRPYCTPAFDLLGCFTNRMHGENNKLTLTQRQTEEVLALFRRIERLTGDDRQGSDLLRLNSVLELLVLINRLFLNIAPEPERTNIPEKLAPVLEHIDTHLEGDLSLEALERTFYLNRFYLSKLFKESTGSNLHNYILYKRISCAKQLLADGATVSQACIRSGFNDYSNFLKQFKRTVGITPGQYKRQHDA